MSKRNKMILVGAGILVAAYYLMKQKQSAQGGQGGQTPQAGQGTQQGGRRR